jgi:hypothetical protein
MCWVQLHPSQPIQDELLSLIGRTYAGQGALLFLRKLNLHREDLMLCWLLAADINP